MTRWKIQGVVRNGWQLQDVGNDWVVITEGGGHDRVAVTRGRSHDREPFTGVHDLVIIYKQLN